jgi:hypothetical protein
MLFCVVSSPLRARALLWRRRRSSVQLVFDFMKTTDDPMVQLAVVWQTLDTHHQEKLLTMLARLMARAIDQKEASDE